MGTLLLLTNSKQIQPWCTQCVPVLTAQDQTSYILLFISCNAGYDGEVFLSIQTLAWLLRLLRHSTNKVNKVRFLFLQMKRIKIQHIHYYDVIKGIFKL